MSSLNGISYNEQPLGSELGAWGVAGVGWGGGKDYRTESPLGLASTSHCPNLHCSGKPLATIVLTHGGQSSPGQPASREVRAALGPAASSLVI